MRVPMGLAFGWIQIDAAGATKVAHDKFLTLVTPGEMFGKMFDGVDAFALEHTAFVRAVEVLSRAVRVERDCALCGRSSISLRSAMVRAVPVAAQSVACAEILLAVYAPHCKQPR